MIDLSVLQGRTVLVAGGAGFVGSALLRELTHLNCRVICLDNYMHGCPEHIEAIKGIIALSVDALDETAVLDAVSTQQVDYIFNCIGDTFVPAAYVAPRRFFDTNLVANLNILRAAEKCNVRRMLYVSSTEVYGKVLQSQVDEAAMLLPVNTYAVSKLAADRLCYTYALEHDMPVVVCRIFNCYGPRETHPYIIPEIISQLSRTNELWLGNIYAERDLTYVYDTARALIGVLLSDLANGEVVNVGSGEAYRVDWLARTIAELMGVSELRVRVDDRRLRKCDIDRFCCNNARLRRITGWQPSVPIKDGLLMTIKWYRDHGSCWCWERSYRDQDAMPSARAKRVSSSH